MKRSRRRKKSHNWLAYTLATCLFAIAGGVLWFGWRAQAAKPHGMLEFFSDDDGATWFADDGTKLPPFDHGGKMAVLAKVYQSKDGRQFVGYLMKYTPEARQKIAEAQITHQLHGGTVAMKGVEPTVLLVKKPGDKDWVPLNDPAGRKVKEITAPDGSREISIVRPE